MTPYLSIVVVARNDNYGVDFNQRLQNMAQWLGYLTEPAQLPTELLLVNYNPVAENPPITEQIDWGERRKYLTTRIITVSPELHEAFHLPDIRKKVTVYEFAAKNAGIRRAKGEFIVSANADLIFDPRLIGFIAKRKLKHDYFYRVPRIDFHKQPFDLSDDFLKRIRRNSFKFYLQGYNYPVILKSFLDEQHLFWETANKLRIWKDILQIKLHHRKGGSLAPFRSFDKQYHVNAAGDFTLLSREAWHKTGGYPENIYSAVHTDAVMIFKAVSAGLRQAVIPYPVYHQDHPRRFPVYVNHENPELKLMYEAMQQVGLKALRGEPIGYENDADWGFGAFDLPEEIV